MELKLIISGDNVQAMRVLGDTEKQVKRTSGVFEDMGRTWRGSMSSMLVGAVSVGALVSGLRSVFQAADEARSSQQKLAGTAKITGVELERLTGVARQARQEFKLATPVANGLTTEVFNLAEKAGDVGQAAPALRAFLDIGAARGMTAAQSMERLHQAILGSDEGTEAFFNVNPETLYKRYADQIGTTAGKLNDQQKAQAVLTAAMETHAKVQGQYLVRLNSEAGAAERAATRTNEMKVRLGEALIPLRTMAFEVLVPLAEGLAGVAMYLAEIIKLAAAPIRIFFDVASNPKEFIRELFGPGKNAGPVLRNDPRIAEGFQGAMQARANGTAVDAMGRPYKTPQQRRVEAERGRVAAAERAAAAKEAAERAQKERESKARAARERAAAEFQRKLDDLDRATHSQGFYDGVTTMAGAPRGGPPTAPRGIPFGRMVPETQPGGRTNPIHQVGADLLRGFDTAEDRAFALADTIRGALTGAMQGFGNAVEGAFAAMIDGSMSAGQAFKSAMLGALAGVARGFGDFFMGKAAAALGEVFLGNPAGLGAAGKFTAAATMMYAVAGMAGGAAGGGATGGGAFGSTFNAGRGAMGGEAVLVIEGGFLDMSDPRQADSFARAMENLSGRRVTVRNG